MEFLLSPEIVEFQRTLRRLITERAPLDLLGRRLTTPVAELGSSDRDLFRTILELGISLAPLPETAGGLGLGMLSMIGVLEECGRALLAVPVTEMMACVIAPLCQSELTNGPDVISALISGGVIVTGHLSPLHDGADRLTVRATADTHDRGVLNGTAAPVPAAELADQLLLLAECDSSTRPLLCLLDRHAIPAELWQPVEISTLDLFRPLSSLTFAECPVTILGTVNGDLEELQLTVALTLAAELSGAAARVVELSVEYAKTRNQFGRPIGSFQAIQHHLADMHLAAEQLRTVIRFAGWCADHDRTQFRDAALAAVGLAGETVPALIERAIQVHGGIGFTFEYPLHLFLRRALVSAQLMGGSSEAFTRLADRFLTEDVVTSD